MNSRSHFFQYLLLFLIVGSGVAGFWYFSQERVLRILAVLSSLVGYVIWGISHHSIEKRLSWSVIGEYLLLGLVILAALSLIVGY